MINQIADHLPLPSETMPRANAVAVARIACRALTDLVEDPDFETDLATTTYIGQESMAAISRFPDFGDFLEEFYKAEKAAFLQSGVDMDTTEQLLREADSLIVDLNQYDLERLPDKIKIMQLRACEAAIDPQYAAHPERSFSRDLGDAVTGVGIIGVDLAAISKTGELLDTIIGNSVGFGALKFRSFLHRIW